MAYYTLIASLPHLPAYFDVDRPPISQASLQERLAVLSESDTLILRQLQNFLTWDRQPLDRTDEQIVAEYERLNQNIVNPVIRELVDDRIDMRTIVSALRRRLHGGGPPVGLGRLVDPIRRNWQHPQFNLQRSFPWIEEFQELMLAGEALDAERVLFEDTWKIWCRLAWEYTFSFEAVLLYLARWEIVDRWTSRNVELGRARFDQLIEETLGDYASLQL